MASAGRIGAQALSYCFFQFLQSLRFEGGLSKSGSLYLFCQRLLDVSCMKQDRKIRPYTPETHCEFQSCQLGCNGRTPCILPGMAFSGTFCPGIAGSTIARSNLSGSSEKVFNPARLAVSPCVLQPNCSSIEVVVASMSSPLSTTRTWNFRLEAILTLFSFGSAWQRLLRLW